jgi:hypothetical protein
MNKEHFNELNSGFWIMLEGVAFSGRNAASITLIAGGRLLCTTGSFFQYCVLYENC